MLDKALLRHPPRDRNAQTRRLPQARDPSRRVLHEADSAHRSARARASGRSAHFAQSSAGQTAGQRS